MLLLALTQWQWEEHSRYIVNVELMGFTDRLSKCQKGKVTPSFGLRIYIELLLTSSKANSGGI